jgi:hypothetical protein
MSAETFNRRRLLRMAGLAGAGSVAVAAGAASPAAAQPTGFSFVPINPYRSIDTRPDPLFTNQLFDIDLITDEDVVQQIPSTAVAVTYNVTVADTVGTGFLALFPADINWPGNSSINWWRSGLLLANGGVVALGESPFSGVGSATVLCGGGGSTPFLIDVTGYYI